MRTEILGALRGLRRRWGSVLWTSAAATVAVAMFLAVASVVDGLLLKQPFPGAEHVAALGRPHARFGIYYYFSREEAAEAGTRSGIPVAAMGSPLPFGQSPSAPRGAQVSTNFFDIIRVRPVLGRTFGPDDEGMTDRAVIGEGLWRARFGADSGVIDRAVIVGDRRVIVVGVAPARFGVPAGTSVWTPMDVRTTVPFQYRVLAWLPDHATGRALESRLPGWRVSSLRDHLAPTDASQALLLFFAAGLLVAAVCTYMGLVQAGEATRRIGESRLRLALGASQWRAIRATLIEPYLSLLVCVAAGAALAPVVLAWLLARLPPELLAGRPIGLDARAVVVVIGLIGLGALVIAAIALPAAARSMRSELSAGHYGARIASHSTRSIRWIVAAQFAVGAPLLYMLGLAAYSFRSLVSADLGFQAENVISAQVPAPSTGTSSFSFEEMAQRVAKLQLLIDRVAPHPHVQNVAVSGDRLGFVPTVDRMRVRLREAAERDSIVAQFARVSSGYFDLLRIPLVSGRTFEGPMLRTMNMKDVYGGVVVDTTLATALDSGADVIGRTIILDFTPATIIGVVKPIRSRQPDEPIQPRFYVNVSPAAPRADNLLVRFNGPSDAIRRAVGRAIQEEYGTPAPADAVLLADELDRLQAGYRGRYELLSLMGWTAAALCVAGTFGVGTYTVARRRRELAVRLAVGASRPRILWTCVRDLLIASAAGITVGLIGGAVIGRQAAHLLYGVTPVDPFILTAILALLVLAVLAGAVLPVRDAWRTDVSAVLRQE